MWRKDAFLCDFGLVWCDRHTVLEAPEAPEARPLRAELTQKRNPVFGREPLWLVGATCRYSPGYSTQDLASHERYPRICLSRTIHRIPLFRDDEKNKILCTAHEQTNSAYCSWQKGLCVLWVRNKFRMRRRTWMSRIDHRLRNQQM